jgi:hypothetical protein
LAIKMNYWWNGGSGSDWPEIRLTHRRATSDRCHAVS